MGIKKWCEKQADLHPVLFFFGPVVVFGLILFGATMLVDHSIRSQRDQLMSADGFKWNHNPHEVIVMKEASMSEDLTHFLVRDVRDEGGYSFWVMGPARFSGHKTVLIIDGVRAAPGGTVTDGIVVGIPPTQ